MSVAGSEQKGGGSAIDHHESRGIAISGAGNISDPFD